MIPHMYMMLMGADGVIASEYEGGDSPPPPSPHSFAYRKHFLIR